MMTSQVVKPTVLVIDSEVDRAATVRDMIEFFDTPAVACADPSNWEAVAASLELAAVFLGAGLSPVQYQLISDQLQAIAPDLPIVKINEDAVNGGE